MGFVKNHLRSILSLLLVLCLAVAFCLPLTVGATTELSTADQDMPVAETAQTKSEPEISKEELAEAWARLKGETENTLYKQVFAPIEAGADDYLREDVLQALNDCFQAQTQLKELQGTYQILTERLQEIEDLPEDICLVYTDNLARKLEVVNNSDPVATLAAMLADFSPTVQDQRLGDALENCLAEMEYTKELMGNLTGLLNALPLWTEIDLEWARISDYSGVSDTTANRYEAMKAEYEYLLEAKDSFFALEEAQQKRLGSDIENLLNDVKCFTIKMVAENTDSIAEQKAELESFKQKTTQEVENLNKKLLFAYGALGMAVIALLMAGLSGVLVLRKPKVQQIDVQQFVRHEELKLLEQQHIQLKNSQNLQEEKLDQGLEKIRRDMQNVQAKKPEISTGTPSSQTEKREAKTSKTDPVQPQGEMVWESQKKVGNLRLDYSTINPNSAELKLDKDGKFELYDDGTLAIGKGLEGRYNTMRIWQDNGLLYLYAPKINGELVEESVVRNLEGSYVLKGQISRAKVAHSNNGVYRLKERGYVEMKKVN